MRARHVFVLATSAAMLACSKHAEPGSCLKDRENVCVDYGGDEAAAGKRMCGGTWKPGEKSCPTAGRLGACARKDGVEYYYSGDPNRYVVSSAKSKCEWGNGAFTALAGAPSASASTTGRGTSP